MRHLVIGQRQKAPNFSAFRWSPHGCLITIGQHCGTTRVVHLPKRTETSLITESDQSRANHQLLQLCTVRTAWSESDQAVRAVHSCNSWFIGVYRCLLMLCFRGKFSFSHCAIMEHLRTTKVQASLHNLHSRNRISLFASMKNWSLGSKNNIMLRLAEHEIFCLLIDVKMPTIVGISTFINRKNSIIG